MALIASQVPLPRTVVRTCEACWRSPVRVVRTDAQGRRDLLCESCAVTGFSRRVDLFPPLGIYKLAARVVGLPPRAMPFKVPTGVAEMSDGKHGGGTQSPPNPGPALPSPPPTPSPPGTPPV
ncbi:hypothetical protein [Streptomyces sp. NPDC006638]|uniref:hypothetical protein n=1 Tax=Streptomyces sp. NPDC006638 TaxID=3157183 RepID=UPI0033AB2E1D